MQNVRIHSSIITDKLPRTKNNLSSSRSFFLKNSYSFVERIEKERNFTFSFSSLSPSVVYFLPTPLLPPFTYISYPCFTLNKTLTLRVTSVFTGNETITKKGIIFFSTYLGPLTSLAYPFFAKQWAARFLEFLPARCTSMFRVMLRYCNLIAIG